MPIFVGVLVALAGLSFVISGVLMFWAGLNTRNAEMGFRLFFSVSGLAMALVGIGFVGLPLTN